VETLALIRPKPGRVNLSLTIVVPQSVPPRYGRAVTARCDAIAVLGARVLPSGLPSPALQRRLERARLAFEQGVAPVVVAAGGKRWWGHSEAVSMKRWLEQLGVPSDCIELEQLSENTAENAFYLTRLANNRGWKRLAIITCDWHLPRATLDFRRCHMDVWPIPAITPARLPERAYYGVREWVCSRLDGARLWRRNSQ